VKRQVLSVAAIIIVLGLAACGGSEGGNTPTAVIPNTPTATISTEQPTSIPTRDALTPEPIATSTTVAHQAPTMASTATSFVATPSVIMTTTNVFGAVLGTAEAPAGWTVQPCEGEGPLLCIMEGEELAGRIELNISHLETLSEFQETLKKQGLTPGSISYQDPEQQQKITAAMRVFVEGYHRVFEQDRAQRYKDEATYTRIETQEAQVGGIPGVRYGFLVTGKDGKVRERWISFAAFDGTLLYLLVPHYDAESFFTFRSNEDLQKFEPYLPKLMANLRLPLPVQESSVKEVVTQGGLPVSVPLFRFYGVGSNPVAEVPPDVTLQVTGQSPNGQWYRVVCPEDKPGECWVSADPKRTKPKTP